MRLPEVIKFIVLLAIVFIITMILSCFIIGGFYSYVVFDPSMFNPVNWSLYIRLFHIAVTVIVTCMVFVK